MVHVPDGNPLNTTLPVGVVQIGCVTAPAVGAFGKAFIVTTLVAIQPVALFVKVKVELPAFTPVTNPPFVTVTFPLLLVHVPPLVGVKLIVDATHTTLGPPIVGLFGIPFITTFVLAVDVQLLLFVTVNV